MSRPFLITGQNLKITVHIAVTMNGFELLKDAVKIFLIFRPGNSNVFRFCAHNLANKNISCLAYSQSLKPKLVGANHEIENT
jgi:hypothetical protein